MNGDRSIILGVGAFLCSLVFGNLKGQCPVTDFALPATACLDETFRIANLSDSGAYRWDFCTGDLEGTPTAAYRFTLPAANGRPAFELARDGDTWYGFVTGTYSNTLQRLTFGNGPDATATLIEPLDLATSLNGPGEVRIFKESDQWFGLVHNTSNGELLKLDFGDMLTNSPTVTSLTTGIGYGNSGFAVGRDAAEGWIVAMTTQANEVTLLRLGSGLVAPGPGDIITSAAVPNPNNLGGIDLVESCGSWYGFACNYGNGNVYRFEFGSDLFTDPAITQVTTLPLSNPGKLRLAADGDRFFALLSSLDGIFYKLDFGTDLTSAPAEVSESDMGGVLPSNAYGLGIAMENSAWNFWLTDASNGDLYHINYPDNCAAEPVASVAGNPLVHFTNPGTYAVSLENTTGMGTGRASRTITVTSGQAPDIAFTSQNICAGNQVYFNSINSSGDITGYAWDFGDTGSSASQNPNHSYTAAGTYDASLFVTAANGCQNLSINELTIYDGPASAFSLPSISQFCTNQEYVFVNQSTYDLQSGPSWKWLVDSDSTASTADMSYTFPSAGSHAVTLVASIPGCQSEHTETIDSISEGPTVDFSTQGWCQAEPTSFTNLTQGDASGYSWDFGDGDTTDQTDPLHAFAYIGDFEVALTATNTDGCSNSSTKTVTIYSKPSANFSLSLPPFSCSGSPSQFNDLTPGPPDSNITGWEWTFGDATSSENSSADRNPQHTFAGAGDYDITLAVTTEFGCADTLQQTVAISPSPAIDFTYENACVNQQTLFTDASQQTVVSWQWQIESSSYPTANPEHAFVTPGDHNAMLEVTDQNGCVSQLTKQIHIPQPPELDFTYSNNCSGYGTVFTDLTTSSEDTQVSSMWTFGGSSEIGDTVIHMFPSTGNYGATLTAVMASGCSYPLSRNVAVVQPPSASFDVASTLGPPPFQVTFENTSLQAGNYLWMFGDEAHSSSTEASPVFTFAKVGQYQVSLTAMNAAGCADIAEMIIEVRIPMMDVAIGQMTINDNGNGTWRVTIRVTNNGNLPVSGLHALLDLTTASIDESMAQTLQPGESTDFQFQTNIAPATGLTYLCARVLMETDLHPDDNEFCLALQGSTLVHPHPNPASDILYVDWVADDADPVSIRLMDLDGREMMAVALTGHSGLNRYFIDTTSIPAGNYLLEWVHGFVRKVNRVMIVGK